MLPTPASLAIILYSSLQEACYIQQSEVSFGVKYGMQATSGCSVPYSQQNHIVSNSRHSPGGHLLGAQLVEGVCCAIQHGTSKERAQQGEHAN